MPPVAAKTAVVRVDPQAPDAAAIARAGRAIRDGLLVGFPTETVYGVAANMLDQKAVDRLYEVKRRFKGKPFTVHIADVRMIRKMGCPVTKAAKAAIKKFWPGPLTIVLKSKDGRKIGFRMPANRVALDLIRAAEVPVVAPSANMSEATPPTDAQAVLRQLDGKIDILIDSGPTDVGVESTVVDLAVTPPAIIREGSIKRSALTRALKS